jgi:hypothetical protein
MAEPSLTTLPRATGPDIAEGIRKVVNQIPRDAREHDILQRDDRTAIMALLVEMHRRRTNNGVWTSKDQLLAEYVMQWADGL